MQTGRVADHRGPGSATVNAIGGLGRDVVVNILGNLATAAVLYLVAAAGGLVPRSPWVMAWSAYILMYVLGGVLVGRMDMDDERQYQRMRFIVRCAGLGVSALFVGTAFGTHSSTGLWISGPMAASYTLSTAIEWSELWRTRNRQHGSAPVS
jgi:hypothetical protein